ncbi:hypothetical protein [Virgisporangium aurantiacum]|uniref:Uncharacterized protein n=1 Tax=Virgisporangium aurantiacum TaxID=175570 RepID=A0A8J4DYY6_9ACTN|nr:hypothetical protein [Virgisporangium aurantiacum]GIJ55419.1 hypothetical protein Vau01_029350 [Virgisporangium aurantiacum]
MTGQADVKWIWMAVALVVVAVPVLTVLFNREIRILQQRLSRLADEPPKTPVQPDDRLLDVLRALSAMRPAEPEFTEVYRLAPPVPAGPEATERYAVNIDLVWIPDPRLADPHGRLLLRRTVHPRWPALDGAPVSGFWISDPLSEDALLTARPSTADGAWERIVLGRPVPAVHTPVPLHPPTDGDRRELRALLGRPAPEASPERKTRPLLDLDATVRVAATGTYVERVRLGWAASDVFTLAVRPVLDPALAALARIAGHPEAPVPAGGHERSSRRSHWYREAELTRAVFADLERRDALEEPAEVTVTRYIGRFNGVLPERVPENWQPDFLEVRAVGAFGRFLGGLVVVRSAGETNLLTRARGGAALLRDPETARALAEATGGDHDVVTLQGLLRAIADDLPTDWKDGRDLDLDPVGPVTAVKIDAR